MTKRKLSFWDIWNMSFGFLGIQFGFALQNANASRILQTFGADVEQLSWFWIAAPLTGMIIQPIFGHLSDRTWTKLGRRKPFFLLGAILAAIALALMPNSPVLTSVLSPMLIGAGMLMVMDASFNIAMQPFRALVADLLPADQTTLGFSIQTFLIGIGAVLGSWLPYILAEVLGVNKLADPGKVPQNVILSFYVGALVIILAILWTIFTTKEYPPDEQYEDLSTGKDKKQNGLVQILIDFKNMPKTMKQLGLVQFFTWFALYSMWVFATPAVAVHIYGAPVGDTHSKLYQDAANWIGIIFGVYNGVAAIYALILPFIAKKIGRKSTHSISLALGGISLISFYFIKDPNLLLIPMIGIGMAWASILAMPYAIISSSIPASKMGIYMGIFNFFITVPQIINGLIGGPIVKRIYDSQAIYAIITSGLFMLLASISVIFVKENKNQNNKL